jgi:integrase
MQNGRRDGKGGLSPRTVRHHHRTIHDALQHAVRWGLVLRNVAQAVDPPRFSNKEMMTLDQVSVQGFLEVARESEYFPLFHLLLFTGMRRPEALGLHWQNINLDLLTLSVVHVMHQLKGGTVMFREPKSARSRRLVDLTPSSGLVLREWRSHQEAVLGRPISSNDLIVTLPGGSPMLPDSVTHAFTKLVRAHGFNGLRLHDLRHSHATLMLQQGIHPKIVQERLGHSSIQVTLDIYSHVAPGMQRAAALRFEEGLTASVTDTQKPVLQTLH